MAKRETKGRAKKTRKEVLASELQGLLKGIDEEGLAFLLRQAHVILHNQQVERLNRRLSDLDQEAPSSAGAEESAGGVRIEDGAGAFTLVIGKARKILSKEEAGKLAKVCYAAPAKSDALVRMYAWMKRERRDIIMDAGISGPRSSLLDGLFRAVRARFQLQS